MNSFNSLKSQIGFGSRTREVNRKVMEERASDYHNPGNNSDYDKNKFGNANDGGILFTTNDGVYAWKPGSPRVRKLVGTKSNSLNGYGAITKMYDDDVVVVCKGVTHDSIANFTNGMDALFGDAKYAGSHINALNYHNGILVAGIGNLIINTLDDTQLGTRNGVIETMIFDHNDNLYDGGSYGLSSFRHINPTTAISALIDFKGHLYTAMYGKDKRPGQNRITNFTINMIGGDFIAVRDDKTMCFCEHNDVLYDCGIYGIYETTNPKNNPRLEILDVRANSMVSVPDKTFRRFCNRDD
jgi:hypothetical protein